MTQTNGVAGGAPTVIAMLKAVEGVLLETSKVPAEYKIHPDDWDDIRLQMEPYMVAYSQDQQPSFAGIRILLDESAERLPKVSNVQVQASGAPNNNQEEAASTASPATRG